MSRDALGFRNPTLVVALLGYVYDADGPVPWEELVSTYAAEPPTWRTVENMIYELVSFGALHRVGKSQPRGPDTRALKPTPLGRAWLDREVLELPGADPFGDVDEIAEARGDELDLEIHDLTPGSET